MTGYDDYLDGPDPISSLFCAVPQWLVGRVPAGALELYAHIARRAGPDGWCWFAQSDFSDQVRTVAWSTYRGYVDALEQAGAVLSFKRHTTGKHGGRNGGLAFYRLPSLERMVPPMTVRQPTRVPGTLTPRLAGVSVGHLGSDVTRSVADRKPRTQTAVSRGLARGDDGRFVDDQTAISRGRERDQTAISNRDQTAISRGAPLRGSAVWPDP